MPGGARDSAGAASRACYPECSASGCRSGEGPRGHARGGSCDSDCSCATNYRVTALHAERKTTPGVSAPGIESAAVQADYADRGLALVQ